MYVGVSRVSVEGFKLCFYVVYGYLFIHFSGSFGFPFSLFTSPLTLFPFLEALRHLHRQNMSFFGQNELFQIVHDIIKLGIHFIVKAYKIGKYQILNRCIMDLINYNTISKKV